MTISKSVKEAVLTVAVAIAATTLGYYAHSALDQKKLKDVAAFLESKGCVVTGPPVAGSEAEKYFYNAYNCGGILVPLIK